MKSNSKPGLSTTRRNVLLSTGLLGTLSAGCLSLPTDSPSSVEYSDGFEEELSGWETDSEVPEDPNNPGNPVEWEITRSSEQAATESASVRYFIDGNQDDGTIWIERPIAVQSGQAYDVSMQADAWSASESFNTLAYLVMYAGPESPSAEGSFPEPGANSTGADSSVTGGLRETLNQQEGWKTYAFDWETAELQTDDIHIAVGISAVWETEMTYFVDDLQFSATPK